MARIAKDIAERLHPLEAGFGQRVAMAADRLGTRGEAAKAIGLSHDQLGKIIAQAAVPSFPAIAALAHKSGLSFEWLAFAEGASDAATNSDVRTSDTVMLPRYDIQNAAAGSAMPFSRRYLENVMRCAADEVAIGEAVGDSMAPTISPHDLLVVHLRRRKIADGQIFVLRLGEELVVNRVQRELDGSLLLLSDNKAYPSRQLSQEQADRMDVVGRLIWRGGQI